MAERVDEHRDDGPRIDGAERVMQHAAEAVIHGHRVRHGDVELLLHQLFGAGAREILGNIQPPGKAAAIVDGLRRVAHHERRHRAHVLAFVVVRAENEYELGVECAQLGGAFASIRRPERRIQLARLNGHERQVRHTQCVNTRRRCSLFRHGIVAPFGIELMSI